ncbi:hypothetical protein [Acetobacter tropicalis]|uniref:hypothetical protein n=1 Tax=Acetobacter tropicalis TaxID=104102 RepID=UPI000776F62A|nr:hypothetical protein [Acetobacter tropicalis]
MNRSLFSFRPGCALGAAVALLLSVPGVTTPARAASFAAPQENYQAFFNQMAAEPLRYGGLSSHGDTRILLGMHQTQGGGLEGEMMRLDSSMRPLVAGRLKGHISATALSQTSRCTFSIALPHRTLTLDGPCSEAQMSGALTNHPRPTQLWSQVTQFISPDTSISEYWLTRSAWQAATTSATAR